MVAFSELKPKLSTPIKSQMLLEEEIILDHLSMAYWISKQYKSDIDKVINVLRLFELDEIKLLTWYNHDGLSLKIIASRLKLSTIKVRQMKDEIIANLHVYLS